MFLAIRERAEAFRAAEMETLLLRVADRPPAGPLLELHHGMIGERIVRDQRFRDFGRGGRSFLDRRLLDALRDVRSAPHSGSGLSRSARGGSGRALSFAGDDLAGDAEPVDLAHYGVAVLQTEGKCDLRTAEVLLDPEPLQLGNLVIVPEGLDRHNRYPFCVSSEESQHSVLCSGLDLHADASYRRRNDFGSGALFMRRHAFAMLALVSAMAFSGACAEDGIVAYVDGRAVKSGQVQEAGIRFSQRLANAPAESRAAFLVGQVVDVAILSDAARREGVAPATVDADRDYARDMTAAQAMLARISGESAPDDAAIRSAYDAQVPGTEYRARHILVPTEEAALEARGRIQNGERFETVAKAVSVDKGSAVAGGELGWFAKERMVPEFGKAVAALAPGFVSEPVKSQFGWHLIQLQEVRTATIPAFEADAPRLRQVLLQRAIAGRIAMLRLAADVRWVAPKPSGW